MSNKRTPAVSASQRPLVLRARPDIQQSAVRFSQQTAHVLKDPFSLELFHLTAEEYFLFDALRQAVSLRDLQAAFQKRFAPRTITLEQLQQAVNQLHSQGLLRSEATGQGEQLSQRSRQRQRSERWQSWGKVLAFRLGSIDATALVEGLYRRVRWVYSRWVLTVVVAIGLVALSLLIGQGRALMARLPSLAELAQPRYWLMWLLTIVLVKIVHELAHAVTCRHVGGRCHEMGVLLLALVPCLYCDVSDVWRLPNKWQRMAVSAAGMIVELVIAAVALIAWWHLQPGLLQTWCLSLVLVCSVGTLLVNANPLLRYDGYYLLSDGVEVPNLAGRAQGLLPAALRRWLWDEPRTADALLSPGQQRWLWVYALAGRVYLTLVLLGIFALLFSWARVYRLENLVILLAGVTLAGMVAGPALAMGRLLRNPGMRFRLRKPRAAALTLVLLALLAAFCFWPVTGCVRAPAVMVPAGAQPVYATTAGTLHYAVPVGTRVEAGEVIARLSQVELELALLRQQGVCGEYRVHVQQLATMRSWNDQASLSLPTVRAEWAAARGRAEKLEAQVAELTIRAPVDGVVIAPPAVAGGERDPSLLPDWTGVPLEPKNLGCRIESGTLLCMVAEPTALEALVAVDQSDADQVQPGQRVRLLLESSPLEPLTGQVVQVARRSEFRQQIHPAVEAGKYHLVQVRLELPPISPLVGARGVAQVEGHASTLSALAVDALRALFRLPW